MERVDLAVEKRQEFGKERVRKLRKVGIIPAVLYRGGKDSLSLKLSARDFLKSISTKAGLNVILNLKITGSDGSGSKLSSCTAIIKEIQRHPVTGGILHVDFNEISLKEKLQVQVKVETKGDAPGVKEGGSLEQIIWEIKVECLPTQIPEKIAVDISELKIGDAVFIKQLEVPQGVKILEDPGAVVLSVKPPHIEKPVEELPEEVVPEEPELIRKERKEEESEEGEAPQQGQSS